MPQALPWRRAMALGLLAVAACRAPSPAHRASAYVAALQSVLTDVRGNPPAGPLDLDAAAAAHLDSTTLQALARAGIIPPACRRVLQAVLGCQLEPRGLVLSVSVLQSLGGGRVALKAVVRGRAAPGDETMIVGRPYQAVIELEPWQGGWRIVRKVRSGGPGVRAG
jgi:hypothetical protein